MNPAQNWKNHTMWTGDNLHIMRGMNSESVDLIYLDPPFNSKKTYSAPIGSQAAGASFKDFWTFDDVDRLWVERQRDSDKALYHVIEAARLTHGNGMAAYLCVMAQRLRDSDAPLAEADREPLPSLRPYREPLSQDAARLRVRA